MLRVALQDPRFVSARFLALSAAVGREEAMGLLPENPDLLRPAADAFALQGDLNAVTTLLGRLDAAQRKARAKDLARIEGRFESETRMGSGSPAPTGRKTISPPSSTIRRAEHRRLGSWSCGPQTRVVPGKAIPGRIS